MRILVVDDEQLALEDFLRELKNATEAEVRGFTTAAEALNEARATPPDVAFLDIRMAQTDGLGLASQLKAINPRVNIIFVTGYSDYMEAAIALHASGYIQKPASAKRIRRELDNLLHPVNPECSGLYARTFGHFTFLVEGQAVQFSKDKSKELLAMLIDRRGAFLTRKEIAAQLWEGDSFSRSRQSQLSHVITALQEDLAGVGAEKILVKRGTRLAVDTNAFGCDLYEHLAHTGAAVFRGEYIEQYSWGEYTKGLLAQ